MKIELYFVCWKKHGELQHAVAGPFVEWDKAQDAKRDLEEASMSRAGYYVVASGHMEVEE